MISLARARPARFRAARTSSRGRPSCSSSFFRPNCGWPAPAGSRSLGPTSAQLGASRLWSRPGSTTAPFGRRAMAASSAAVAGTEPVEPAAMTGPGAPRSASRARLGADQQVAPRPRIEQAFLGEIVRPGARRDLQELQRDLPVAGEIGGHARPQPRPCLGRDADLVDEAARASRRAAQRRRARPERPAPRRGVPAAARTSAPDQPSTSLVKHELTFHRADGGRKLDRIEAVGGEIVLVDIAERADRAAGAAAGRAGRENFRGWRGRRAASADRG